MALVLRLLIEAFAPAGKPSANSELAVEDSLDRRQLGNGIEIDAIEVWVAD